MKVQKRAFQKGRQAGRPAVQETARRPVKESKCWEMKSEEERPDQQGFVSTGEMFEFYSVDSTEQEQIVDEKTAGRPVRNYCIYLGER